MELKRTSRRSKIKFLRTKVIKINFYKNLKILNITQD